MPGSMMGTGTQKDRHAPCLQGAYILVREKVNPPGNQYVPDFRWDGAMQKTHKIT